MKSLIGRYAHMIFFNLKEEQLKWKNWKQKNLEKTQARYTFHRNKHISGDINCSHVKCPIHFQIWKTCLGYGLTMRMSKCLEFS